MIVKDWLLMIVVVYVVYWIVLNKLGFGYLGSLVCIWGYFDFVIKLKISFC